MAHSESEDKKTGTRVFKKTSPNGKITTYLGKRDFIDRGDYVDLIDGMVLVDEETVREGRRVTATLLAAFRYGREDLDVLGLTFRKDLISQQYQPAPGDTGKPCGVDYELKTIVGTPDSGASDRQRRNSSVRLAIRKLTYAPWEARPQPTADVSKDFMMSAGLLHMEASLDKEMYYHGESIAVNVHLQNNSNKSVKKLKVSVVQIADICLFTTASYTCEVARVESAEGFPVGPGATLSKVFSVCPLLRNNKDKRGLALDGQLKHEDTNLASSTIMQPSTTKESLGIVVAYRVKIRAAIAGPLGGELVAELPFTLTHAKPAETPERGDRSIASRPTQGDSGPNPLDIDLIQLNEEINDLRVDDDDLIFEDFTRLRLKGADSTDEASPSVQPPSLI
ncbi:Beta-arrestin-2 [Trichostrongylus colubriformis]|uniref:Beta-arrestin-2 n=1 Tax=Trichostrongylus colubriformis TaxID=6319 RepID=A0AAN8FN54_TRICO